MPKMSACDLDLKFLNSAAVYSNQTSSGPQEFKRRTRGDFDEIPPPSLPKQDENIDGQKQISSTN